MRRRGQIRVQFGHHSQEIVVSGDVKRRIVTGTGISSGCAVGIAYVYRDILTRDIVSYSIRRDEIEAEIRRIKSAMEQVADDVTRMKDVVASDVGRRLLRALLGYDGTVLAGLPQDSVVVARRLLPSDTVHLNKHQVRGIVVAQGGVNSHSAILARQLDIPAVSNIGDDIDTIVRGDPLLVDGDRGVLILFPDNEDTTDCRRKNKADHERVASLLDLAAGPAVTVDGEAVKVYANAASSDDFTDARLFGADGVGLFRIEQIYLASRSLPDEACLIDQFRSRLRKVPGKEVVIRLLDIGGDKELPYLEFERGLNPSLGLRGVRTLLKYDYLLKAQLRAILAVSREFKVKILVPMITLPEEMRQIRDFLNECRREMIRDSEREYDYLSLGAMVETPAAVIGIRELVEVSDFLSIGTNDLIQYTMAAGRESPFIDEYYAKGMPVVMNSVREVLSVARQHDIECSICGEIAADINWTESLLRAGACYLSVSPRLIPEVKQRVRQVTL